MDPDEALAVIRALVDEGHDFNALAEAITDLDEWLTKGGFLPSDWNTRKE